MHSIAPAAAQQLLQAGAILVDIRERDAHAHAAIPGARNLPLAELSASAVAALAARSEGAPLVFHCQSGTRTRVEQARLQAAVPAGVSAYVLDGGLQGWQHAGLAIVRNRAQPLPLQRQVQVTAGGMIVAASVLGAVCSPWFHLAAAMIGGGLVFAGLSGTCALARVLARMPWNRAIA